MVNKKKTIILIDDHDIVRKGLKQLIEEIGDYDVIGEYQNGLAFIKDLPLLKQFPDLFVLDYSMPIMNGLEVLKEVVTEETNLKFLVLTQHLDETIINNVYKNGARGFLHKTCSADQLKLTMDNIITYGYSNVTEILKRIRTVTNSPSKPKLPISLTDRELELIALVCNEEEFTYQKIADLMNISIKTVDKYRAQLFSKLNVKSKVGIVLYSYRYQLTSPFVKP